MCKANTVPTSCAAIAGDASVVSKLLEMGIKVDIVGLTINSLIKEWDAVLTFRM